MAEISQLPMIVDLEPVQLVAADGTPTPEYRYGRDLPAETLCWLYDDGGHPGTGYRVRQPEAPRRIGVVRVLPRSGSRPSRCRSLSAQDRLAVSPISRVGRLSGAWHPARTRRRRVARNLAWRAGIHQEMLRPDIDP